MSTQHEPPFDTPAYNNYLQLMNQTPTKEQLKELCEPMRKNKNLLDIFYQEYIQ